MYKQSEVSLFGSSLLKYLSTDRFTFTCEEVYTQKDVVQCSLHPVTHTSNEWHRSFNIIGCLASFLAYTDEQKEWKKGSYHLPSISTHCPSGSATENFTQCSFTFCSSRDHDSDFSTGLLVCSTPCDAAGNRKKTKPARYSFQVRAHSSARTKL